MRRRPGRHEQGFSLIEAAVIMVILAVLAATAVMSFDGYGEAEATRGSARALAAAIDYARGEAIRTGNHHILFVGTDTTGAALQDADGNPVPVLVLDDGRPGSAGQDCLINAGESVQGIRLHPDVALGLNQATAKVPQDDGAGVFLTGSTFTDPLGLPASWVLFRPDGVPRAINSACTIGALGSGAGGFYLGNATRDAAVVLSALGAARVFTWEAKGGTWN